MKLLIFQLQQIIELLQDNHQFPEQMMIIIYIRFVKDIVSRSGFGDDSSIMNLRKYMKETEISDCNKRLINFVNMNVEGSSNIQYDKLPVEEIILKEKYTMIHSLHIPIIPNIISTILYEICQLSEQFPKNNILSMKSFYGTESTLINIPK